MQSGYVAFEVQSPIGGVFTFGEEIAQTLLVDTEDGRVRVGFPEALDDFVTADWLHWSMYGKELTMVGFAPGRNYSFQVRIPLSDIMAQRFNALQAPIEIGVIRLLANDMYEVHVRNTLDRSKVKEVA
jgi:hypothetical protein